MPTDKRTVNPARPRRYLLSVLAVVSVLALSLSTLLAPPAAAAPWQQEATPSPTPESNAQPTSAEPAATEPAGTPTPQGPTPTATAVPTPRSGLVLVPLAVRQGAQSPDAQPGTATIKGRVVDSGGHGLIGQIVKLTRGDFSTTVVTDGQGAYEVPGLEPGRYSVVVDKQICSPVEGLELAPGAMAEVEFVEVRKPSSPVASGRTATATVTRTPTKTPTPRPTATVTATPTAPSQQASERRNVSFWNMLGFDFQMPNLSTPFYYGLLGGVVLVVVGIVVAAVRR